ncbi:MAG: hypothetical protein L3J77_04405 [Thermoplasmata archaeon]|nr:hypothetical protein [Thermoplasmata archaeon]
MRDRSLLATAFAIAVVAGFLLSTAPVGSVVTLGSPTQAGSGASSLTPFRPGSPSALGAAARMIVTTSDPASVPNDGLGTNLTAFGTASFPANSSFQTGAEEVIGAFDAVFGLFTNDKTAPVAFYEIFTNSSDQVVRLEYWNALPVGPGAPFDFRIQQTMGTVWTLTVNGGLFGGSSANATFDFGAVTADWGGGFGFSEIAIYSTTTTVPSSYIATTALYVHRPSTGWYLPRNGTATYTGPPGAAWGVEGRSSLPSLAPGEVESGTSLAAVRNTSSLWSGGPVPVLVTVAPTAPTVPGLGVLAVSVSVSTLGGAALGDVPVYVGDTLGGNASPSTVLTSSTGTGATLLSAPNESASAADLVVAVVTILGYSGSASAPITVTASVQVGVVPSATALAVGPGASTSVTFRTVDASGRSYPGIALIFGTVQLGPANASGGNLVLTATPDAGITDASGNFTIVVTAPPGAGTFALVATVTALGAWGHASVHVDVRPPTPTFWQRYGTTVVAPVVGLLVLVAIVLAVVLSVRRERRRRPPLPAMDLRTLRQERGSGGSEAKGAAPPVTRTPPASGSP